MKAIPTTHTEGTPAGRGALGDEDSASGRGQLAVVKIVHPRTRQRIELDMGLLACGEAAMPWVYTCACSCRAEHLHLEIGATLFDAIPSLDVFAAPMVVAQFRAHMLAQLDLRTVRLQWRLRSATPLSLAVARTVWFFLCVHMWVPLSSLTCLLARNHARLRFT